jgi:N-acetylglucosaminyldiphosphoundecaprenol N-acetyl-beta-D-mannosaminyltransferase
MTLRAPFRRWGVSMHPWTMDETLAEIERALADGRCTQHTVVNVAKIVNAQHDPELAQALAHADIVNIDGMGVVWAARLLGERVPERVAGIDLFAALLGVAERGGYSVYLLGATQEVLDGTVAAIRTRHPALRIAGAHHGYFGADEEPVVDAIARSNAHLLFVAMSSPQKERFIDRWSARLGVRFVMGVGGSFDVVAGKTRRAPAWMQHTGLEWAFRVAQEPRRMWRRYLDTNARFAWMVVKEWRRDG